MRIRLLYTVCGLLWLLLSVLIALSFASRAILAAQQQFNVVAQKVSEQISHTLLANETALDSYATFSLVSGSRDNAIDRFYTRQLLSHYPQIVSFQRLEKVPLGQQDAFIKSMRARYGSNLSLHAYGSMAKPATTDLYNEKNYFPIAFIEPLVPAQANLLGADITSSPSLKEALLEVIRKGGVATSSPLSLIDGTYGYTMIRAVEDFASKQALQAHVPEHYVMTFIRSDFFKPASGSLPGGMKVKLFCVKDNAINGHVPLMSFGNTAVSGVEKLLFPELHFSGSLGSDAQPMRLLVTWQLGWAQIGAYDWSMIIFLSVLIFALITVSMLSYVRFSNSRQAKENRLFYLANHDRLTGLANRNLFYDRLQHAISRQHRSGKRMAVLFLDMDRFKPVNDTYGHVVGDRVLQLIASRIKTALRGEDTVARLGGDEFSILLEDIDSTREVDKVVARLKDSIQHPYEIETYVIQLGVSIGIAYYPEDGTLIEELLAVADRKMYGDKNDGESH